MSEKWTKENTYYGIAFAIILVGIYIVAYYTQNENLIIFCKFITIIFAGILGVVIAVSFVLLIFYIFGWTTSKTLCATFKTILFLTETEQDKLRKMEIESENRKRNK